MREQGQWIELSWDDPIDLREVQLTFDSGFHRQLTLTASDSTNRSIIRGPQPEMVKDYKLVITDADGSSNEVVSVQDNYLRLKRHPIEAKEVRSVRLQVDSTHGSNEVRVFEIRCY